LETDNGRSPAAPPKERVPQVKAVTQQLTLFELAPDPIVEDLKALDLDSLSPRQALDKLYELKAKVRGR
jgi:DNA mismatch repair ATPase MutS